MRRFAMKVVLAASVTLLLASLVPVASANNDPHRFFLPQGSIDFAAQPDGPCTFPVHLDTIVNKEYGKQTVLADGSTLFTITGSMVVRVSANGKSFDLNVSGPGTYLIASDGSTWSFSQRGQMLVLSPQLTDLGYPSDFVLTSGLWEGTAATADNWAGSVYTGVSHLGHLEMDICAALS
jgi:hypothetical protein